MLSNFNSNSDWFYIILAGLIVDYVAVFFAKYPGPSPYFKVDALNDWYTKFGAVAVASDVLGMYIGIFVARFVYTYFKFNNWIYFIGILLAFQLFHDGFFYYAVIKPFPKGHNQMIDVFKNYANENGAKILFVDGLMLVSTMFIASGLASMSTSNVIGLYFLKLYAFTYILYTNP
jgi:hypothetical protein